MLPGASSWICGAPFAIAWNTSATAGRISQSTATSPAASTATSSDVAMTAATAWTAQRRRDVDPSNARVGVRAPHERDVVHARQRQVAHVARGARDQPGIFLALDFRTHQSWCRHGQLEYSMRDRRPGLVAAVLVSLVLSACTGGGSGSAVGSDAEALAGRRAPIDHIIVLFLENRTFDHLFGTYPGAEGLASYSGRQTDKQGVAYPNLPAPLGRDGKPDSRFPVDLPNT